MKKGRTNITHLNCAPEAPHVCVSGDLDAAEVNPFKKFSAEFWAILGLFNVTEMKD